jgi:hypothetical protein
VSGDRRAVRVAPSFFEDLDNQLGAERGPNGEPSAHDFLVLELTLIIEVVATRFDELPPLISGRDDYRVLIASGLLVPSFAVVGQLASDNAVELVELDIGGGEGL